MAFKGTREELIEYWLDCAKRIRQRVTDSTKLSKYKRAQNIEMATTFESCANDLKDWVMTTEREDKAKKKEYRFQKTDATFLIEWEVKFCHLISTWPSARNEMETLDNINKLRLELQDWIVDNVYEYEENK